MINEEARVDPFDDNKQALSGDDIFGAGDGETTGLDYSKPFRMFDEQGLGVIAVDQFRVMLYRLHVNSLLRERQVVALINRFDVDRKGETEAKGFLPAPEDV